VTPNKRGLTQEQQVVHNQWSQHSERTADAITMGIDGNHPIPMLTKLQKKQGELIGRKKSSHTLLAE
jgi:hypothetical protein